MGAFFQLDPRSQQNNRVDKRIRIGFVRHGNVRLLAVKKTLFLLIRQF